MRSASLFFLLTVTFKLIASNYESAEHSQENLTVYRSTNQTRQNSAATKALSKLQAGNERFMTGQNIHPSSGKKRRMSLIDQQSPFAVILTCSDSRIATSLIFDQGIGDIFAIRNAGNLSTDVAEESIKYAVAVLKAPLIVVMGHQNCGAVKAAMQQTPGYPKILSAIPKTVQNAKNLQDAVMMNIKTQINTLQKYLAKEQLIDNVEIVGAYYRFDSGKVDFFQQDGSMVTVASEK
jgi:carbonic anhydrase